MSLFAPQPLVTVIIPTYNRGSIIKNAIESVLNQTYNNIQLIVVDDDSNDNTKQVVKYYPNVEYVFQIHGGQGKARNTGLKQAKGTYVASLDSDDIWKSDFLAICVEKLELDNLDFVFTNWLQAVDHNQGFDFFSCTGLLTPYIGINSNNWVSLSYSELREVYINACPSPSSSLVIRRSSIVNGWNEQVHIADDWCMILDIVLTSKCKAAFTTQRLWLKQTDGKNIYDGRNYFEVLQLLYINDFDTIVNLHRDKLSKRELKKIRYVTAHCIYRYTINRFINRINMEESFIMFKRALKDMPHLFFIVLYNMTSKKIKKLALRPIKRSKKNTVKMLPISDIINYETLNDNSYSVL